MSGIYIPMEMPHDENDSIHILRDGTVVVYRTGSIDFYKAIPVPAHGRGIDADALDVIGYCGIPKGRKDTFDDGVMWLAEQIDSLPTIIPASGGKENE